MNETLSDPSHLTLVSLYSQQAAASDFNILDSISELLHCLVVCIYQYNVDEIGPKLLPIIVSEFLSTTSDGKILTIGCDWLVSQMRLLPVDV